jgi:hypothetical protein
VDLSKKSWRAYAYSDDKRQPEVEQVLGFCVFPKLKTSDTGGRKRQANLSRLI